MANNVTRLRGRVSRLGARLTALGSALLAFVLLSGHIGTNQVVFEGQAGGYPVRVLINPPGVVPGQVPITVRVLSGTRLASRCVPPNGTWARRARRRRKTPPWYRATPAFGRTTCGS